MPAMLRGECGTLQGVPGCCSAGRHEVGSDERPSTGAQLFPHPGLPANDDAHGLRGLRKCLLHGKSTRYYAVPAGIGGDVSPVVSLHTPRSIYRKNWMGSTLAAAFLGVSLLTGPRPGHDGALQDGRWPAVECNVQAGSRPNCRGHFKRDHRDPDGPGIPRMLQVRARAYSLVSLRKTPRHGSVHCPQQKMAIPVLTHAHRSV